MSGSIADRALALAGLLQCARLVQRIAQEGLFEDAELDAVLASVFRLDADSTEDVYGGVRALAPGLRRVVAQLDGSDRDAAQTRMAMNVLHLERRFAGSPQAMQKVHEGLEALRRGREPWEPTHPEVLARLGELYAEVVSPLGPKVMVAGNPVYLSQAEVVAEVRAALLAALRSAMLWRQLGGSWFDLLLSRRRMVDTAQELLAKGG